MDDLTVAAACMTAEPGRIERNLERIRSIAMEAAASGADMLCLPELSVTGYSLSDPESLCLGRNGRMLTERLLSIAKATNLVILAGLVEPREGAPPYIGHVAAGPEGLLGVHRKTHLSPTERGVFSAGDDLRVFAWRNTTFGIQLCYEAHFPEISTVMTLKGAEVLFLPHASPRGDAEQKRSSWMRHLPGRAFDNGVFVVAVNQVGETEGGFDFPGVIVILGPDGREYAQYAGKEEAIVYARLRKEDLDAVRRHRMRYFLPWRRPELYSALLEDRVGDGARGR
jgi:N-carbamoylputrescine amidase